jgi:mono/diheme cytochrome c family protein
VTLADGSTVVADDAYITQSIREPSSQVHEGFDGSLMPPFGPDAVSDDDIAAVIAYMETLAE